MQTACAILCETFATDFETAGAEVLHDPQLCCALIALEEQAGLFPPGHAPESYESTGLVVASPEKLLELNRSRRESLRPRMSVRQIFQTLGVGLLEIGSRKIEWYFEDGSRLTIEIGASIDMAPASARVSVLPAPYAEP